MGQRLEASPESGPPVALELPAGRRAVIGRADDADLRVPDDPRLSRRHAEVWLEGARLRVRRLQGSSNPIYRAGKAEDSFSLSAGEQFTIGKTTFRFVAEAAPAEPTVEQAPLFLQTMSTADLYSIGEASDRLKLLDLLELPEILRSRDRKDFYAHIAAMLRSSTAASWACVVTEEGRILGEDAADAGGTKFRPSRSLLRKAVQDAPQPTLYSWAKPGEVLATAQQGLDWALCAAARIPGEPAVVFYAAGPAQTTSETLSRDRARFVGLVADMVGRSVAMDRLTTMESRLERFFAGPVVSKILKSPDLRELEPRLAQSTILFFDIRGFSKRTEENNREILGYISQLRKALTSMTEIILEEGGVVLQYMGDGILACWNVPFEDPDHAARACRSALRMARRFGEATGGWRCGIGLHTGEVVAGSIGSEQVFSYGVLGTIVNQASRIEGITKLLGTSVLASAEVAASVPESAASSLRLGRFQPAGMSRAVELYEMQDPPGDPARAAAFAKALSALEAARWEEAAALFGAFPPADGPAAALKAIAEAYRRAPPHRWSGVVELASK